MAKKSKVLGHDPFANGDSPLAEEGVGLPENSKQKTAESSPAEAQEETKDRAEVPAEAPPVAEGPALSETEGPVLSETEGPVLSETEGPVLSETEGPVLSTVEGPAQNRSSGRFASASKAEAFRITFWRLWKAAPLAQHSASCTRRSSSSRSKGLVM
jgi:hypothetical protein